MTILEKQNTLISFLKHHVQDKQVVIGLSGGIDSTTVAFLAVEALGAEKYTATFSPPLQTLMRMLDLPQKLLRHLVFRMKQSLLSQSSMHSNMRCQN